MRRKFAAVPAGNGCGCTRSDNRICRSPLRGPGAVGALEAVDG